LSSLCTHDFPKATKLVAAQCVEHPLGNIPHTLDSPQKNTQELQKCDDDCNQTWLQNTPFSSRRFPFEDVPIESGDFPAAMLAI